MTTREPPTARVTYTWPTAIEPYAAMEAVQAYGDSDDHLRLTVLLSQILRLRGGDREAAEACQSAKQVWSTRLEALKRLISDVAVSSTPFPLLVDVDALYTGRLSPKARWDDSQFRSDRVALLRVLAEAAARSRWTLVRLAPVSAVTDMLEEAGMQSNEASEPGETSEEPLLNLIGAELRPILRWLLFSGYTDKKTAAEMIDASDDEEPSLDIVSTAFECLKPSVRRTAKTLSALRPPQRINGSFGPFPLSSTISEVGLPCDHIDQLRLCGFLQPTPVSRGCLQMPRTVRQLLSGRQHFMADSEVREVHRKLVSGHSSSSLESELEAHHHAVMSGNAELAGQTARYYGNDLRYVAYSLSIEGRQRPEAYREVADVYRSIVSDFDNEDAYAWEYLGYNLARCTPVASKDEVRHAYERAVALAPTNPLYRGRLVGFSAKLGENVHDDFRRWMIHFSMNHGVVGARYFGLPVLAQLREVGKYAEVTRLKAEWPQLGEENVR